MQRRIPTHVDFLCIAAREALSVAPYYLAVGHSLAFVVRGGRAIALFETPQQVRNVTDAGEIRARLRDFYAVFPRNAATLAVRMEHGALGRLLRLRVPDNMLLVDNCTDFARQVFETAFRRNRLRIRSIGSLGRPVPDRLPTRGIRTIGVSAPSELRHAILMRVQEEPGEVLTFNSPRAFLPEIGL